MDETYYTLDNDPDFLNTLCKDHHNIWRDYAAYLNRDTYVYCEDIFIENQCIYQKSFIRFELHDNDPKNVHNAINEIRTIVVSFYKSLLNNHGKYELNINFNISLRLNIALLEEYGKAIDLINVEELLAQHTDEEMDNLIVHKNNNDCIINTKYIFNNRKGFYLDIPLLNEFYNYESIINHTVSCCKKKFLIKSSNVKFKHFKSISIGHEKITMITEYSTPFTIDHTLEKISAIVCPIIVCHNTVLLCESIGVRYYSKHIYVILPTDNILPILLKPHDAIMYKFNNYVMYKINYKPNITELEFDFIKKSIIIYLIMTYVV
jgi:hypothetical protein